MHNYSIKKECLKKMIFNKFNFFLIIQFITHIHELNVNIVLNLCF